MKRIGSVTIFFALVACGQMTLSGKVADNVYVSPMGNFTCRLPSPTVRVTDAFEAHAGTIRFLEEFWFTRIDVEEFNPKVPDLIARPEFRRALYEGYLQKAILPVVQRGVRDATSESQEHVEVDGKPVLASWTRLPKASSTVTSKGERLDDVRISIQYSDGNFMYVVSALNTDRPEIPRDTQHQGGFIKARRAFQLCKFPG